MIRARVRRGDQKPLLFEEGAGGGVWVRTPLSLASLDSSPQRGEPFFRLRAGRGNVVAAGAAYPTSSLPFPARAGKAKKGAAGAQLFLGVDSPQSDTPTAPLLRGEPFFGGQGVVMVMLLVVRFWMAAAVKPLVLARMVRLARVKSRSS